MLLNSPFIVHSSATFGCFRRLNRFPYDSMPVSTRGHLQLCADAAQHKPLSTVDVFVKDLQRRLDNAADPRYRVWANSVILRGETFSRGVKMPHIRTITKEWVLEHKLEHGAKTDGALIQRCFESDMTEDKLAAMFYIWDTLQPQRLFSLDRLNELEILFENNLIRPWNVVDSFSIRVLQRLLMQFGRSAGYRIASWRNAENCWQARASVVAFIHHARYPEYHDIITEVCGTVIHKPERFAKTSVGWMMREMSRVDHNAVMDFIDHHINFFSLESIRNALKRCDPDVRERYVVQLKQSQRSTAKNGRV